MRERPILFSAPMVRAILDHTKTQTRRVAQQTLCGVRVARLSRDPEPDLTTCPYGQPGDRLWVRESAWLFGRWVANGYNERGRQRWRFQEVGRRVRFEQPLPHELTYQGSEYDGFVWRPSIHVPRWGSRLVLTITDVRVEPLQKISDADVAAEGVRWQSQSDGSETEYIAVQSQMPRGCFPPRICYWRLWDSLNAARGYAWDVNPQVWVVQFTPTAGASA